MGRNIFSGNLKILWRHSIITRSESWLFQHSHFLLGNMLCPMILFMQKEPIIFFFLYLDVNMPMPSRSSQVNPAWHHRQSLWCCVTCELVSIAPVLWNSITSNRPVNLIPKSPFPFSLICIHLIRKWHRLIDSIQPLKEKIRKNENVTEIRGSQGYPWMVFKGKDCLGSQ